VCAVQSGEGGKDRIRTRLRGAWVTSERVRLFGEARAAACGAGSCFGHADPRMMAERE
jgi:hypothetical protein